MVEMWKLVWTWVFTPEKQIWTINVDYGLDLFQKILLILRKKKVTSSSMKEIKLLKDFSDS